MSTLTLMHSSTPERHAGADDPAALRAVLELQAALLSCANTRAAANAFVRELASQLAFDQVSIALVRELQVEVIAVSDGLPVVAGTPAVERLAGAMAEALDQGASVVLPEPRHQSHPQAQPRITLAHARLLAAAGGGSVASVPIMVAGSAVGALCVERRGQGLVTPQQLETLEHLACLAGPVLQLMQNNERPLFTTVRARLRERLAALQPPQRAGLRWALIGGVVAVLGLTGLPAPFHVGGHARLEGAVQRVLVAPADGFLKRVHVRPGEPVRAGQTLIELAEQDLQLDKKRWQSQLAQLESAYGAANARADRAQLVINQSRLAEAQAQLELIDMKLERGRIEAPFDGFVIQGDLSQSLGAPLQQGAELMTIAPRDQYRVMVAVDERDIGTVQVGQNGSVALSALPWQTLPVLVKRITPMANALEGRNVFEVEAELLDPPAGLRPGLQGSARLRVGEQPLLWSWSHRLVDATRLLFWEWFG